MARKYQLVSKPIATASGEPGEWKMWAHGAKLNGPDANALIERHKALGYITRKLPL